MTRLRVKKRFPIIIYLITRAGALPHENKFTSLYSTSIHMNQFTSRKCVRLMRFMNWFLAGVTWPARRLLLGNPPGAMRDVGCLTLIGILAPLTVSGETNLRGGRVTNVAWKFPSSLSVQSLPVANYDISRAVAVCIVVLIHYGRNT